MRISSSSRALPLIDAIATAVPQGYKQLLGPLIPNLAVADRLLPARRCTFEPTFTAVGN